MARNEETPTVEYGEHPGGGVETVTRHPAFAQIGASRVSGGARLYGSDFEHQNYVRVRIAASEMHRSLSNDWPYARRDYIEVDLSEAQWATFVSSMNVGSGVQCTLRYKDGEAIPGIAPPTEDPHKKYEVEAREKLTRALSQLDQLTVDIAALKISEKQKAALKGRVDSAHQHLVSNIPFVLKQFAEHMETTVEKAKIEVNAYVTSAVMRAGIKALGGQDGEAPLLQLHSAAKNETA
jgi:hypothetical protein